MQYFHAISKMTEWSLFVSKANHSISVIQVYAQTNNAEAEVERLNEDLQGLLELTPKKDVLFIIGDWNAKGGSQETPGVTGKFGLEVQNEAGQSLIKFFREHTGHSKNPLPTTQDKTLQMDITRWPIQKSDWLYYLQPRRRSFIQSAKSRPGADCGSNNELHNVKLRLKLKKVGQTPRPFRY